MSSKKCYNNAAFSGSSRSDGEREVMNNRLEVGAFQAYNETFIDDNGFARDEPYIDIREDFRKSAPKCRRSIADPHRYEFIGKKEPKLSVGFHKDFAAPLHEYGVEFDDRKRIPVRSSMKECYESVDALYKRYDEIDSANEEYVDYPEDRMGFDYRGSVRESPLGCSGTFSTETPSSSPKKLISFTPTKRSPAKLTPTKISRRNSAVLAPMIAQLERQKMALNRSSSTIISTPKKPIVIRTPRSSGTHFNQTRLNRASSMIVKSSQNLSGPVYHTPVRLPSFNHIFENDFMDPPLERMKTPNRKPPNTAIITPTMRSSIAPLLPVTPPHEASSPPPAKSPSNYSKVSWASLPTIHLPIELLCFFGFLLLVAGAATAILCFYLLSISGKRYFLNFGAIAGFASLMLGLLSCRTNKWRWLPHRNYLTGYILLGTFSLLNAACLGGIVYAIEVQSSALMDTLGGAVCAVSVLLILGSVIGTITSGCCHRPPPDNRVAHCVTGFRV